MPNPTSTAHCSDLAGFILGKQDKWATNRKPSETKWQRNTDAVKSISTGHWKKGEAEDWRSDTFYNITKTKCISAYALVCDMLLQGGKVPYALSVSPWSMVVYDDLPEVLRASVDEAIEDQTKHIGQQLMDCDADRSLMFGVMACAVMGETYAKKTVRTIIRRGYRQVSYAPPGMPPEEAQQYTRYEPWEEQIVAPAWEYVSNWDIFRDLETDDLKACAGIIHRAFFSPYELRNKKGMPYCLDCGIDRAIEDVASSSGGKGDSEKGKMQPGLRELQHRERNIEVFEFWGRAPRRYVEDFERDMEAQQAGFPEDVESYAGKPDTLRNEEGKGDDVEIMAMVANRQIIRFARTKPEDRPFYRVAWEERVDEIGGVGVADNLEDVQMVLNGAIRGFEDNKRLAGDVILAFKARFFSGSPDIFPGKPIEVAEECDDARKAVQQITIQDVGQGYVDVIRIFERMGDVVSMIPQIAQGVRPEKSADTAYELSQMLENAGKYLGSVIRNFDQCLIEPMITDFYKYNMLDPDAPGKGDFVVKAQGFSSFQARIVRVQKLMQMLGLVLSSPVLLAEVNITEHLKEIYKAEDMDTDILLKSDADKQQEKEEADAATQEQLALAQGAEEEAAARDEQAKEADHQRKMELEDQKATNKVLGDRDRANAAAAQGGLPQ